MCSLSLRSTGDPDACEPGSVQGKEKKGRDMKMNSNDRYDMKMAEERREEKRVSCKCVMLDAWPPETQRTELGLLFPP